MAAGPVTFGPFLSLDLEEVSVSITGRRKTSEPSVTSEPYQVRDTRDPGPAWNDAGMG